MNPKANKILSSILIVITISFLILLFIFKADLVNYTSNALKSNNGEAIESNAQEYIDSAFNYRLNNQSYRVTFLEFGSKNCSACKNMEPVMEDLKTIYSGKVKVVFCNVQLSENELLMKYFGIAVIPTQILLDKSGKEFFRHNGYYSAHDLSDIILQHL